MPNSTTRPWSDLPQELISAIAGYITASENYLHIRSFRSVCHSWRASCPPLSRLSILSPLLPLGIDRPSSPLLSPRHHSAHSTLSVTVIYVLRQPVVSELLPFKWILFVDEFESRKLKFRIPFSNESFLLPSCFPKSVNLFDFHVHELGRFYNLSYSSYYDHTLRTKLTKPRYYSEDVLKVVLFSDGSAAVALFQGGKLGLIKFEFGEYEEEWEVMHDGKGFRFDDIVDYKGRVLGVDRRGRVYQISHSPSEINPIVRSIADGDGRRNRLVVSLGQLYLVVKCDGSANFKVYKLHEKISKWVGINSIGARTFFFGIDFSFSASARKIEAKNDCIFFKQHSFRSYKGETDDKAMFCNSLNGDLYVGLHNLNDATLDDALEFFSGGTHILWPPPAWFRPTNRLERMKIVDVAIDELLVMISKSLETKFQDPTVEATCVSYENFQRHTCLEIRKQAHNMKRTLQTGKDIEHELKAWSIDWSNRMKRLRKQTETKSLETMESQRVSEYYFCWCLQYKVWFTVGLQNTMILQSEFLIDSLVYWYNRYQIGVPLRIGEMGRIEAVVSLPTN